CNLQPRDAAKMPESAWKLLFYSLSWSYGAYLLFGTDYPFFHDPPSVFYGWRRGMAVPADIAVAYLLQGSFYGHSLYAAAYMDTWRRDSPVMLLHHAVTLTLLAASYAFRDPKIQGTLWGSCSDPKIRETLWGHHRQEGCAGSVPAMGTLTLHCPHPCPIPVPCLSCPRRFWFRLYWFPLKVLYATCHCSLQAVPNIPFYFFFNGLLLVLTLMNIYWFLYIVLFVAKVLLGQMQEVNDVREYDVEESRK
ncbi:CERS1 synthase, partial [Leucopsar rothschildi]|nr:CERS1 synthase [Leucopsar rothschildi]